MRPSCITCRRRAWNFSQLSSVHNLENQRKPVVRSLKAKVSGNPFIDIEKNTPYAQHSRYGDYGHQQRFFAVNAKQNPKLEFPSSSNARDPSSWTKILEPALPLELRNESHTENHRLKASHAVIPNVVVQARNQANIDILCHLGIEQGRWQAMLWAAKVMIDISQPPASLTHELRFTSIDIKSTSKSLRKATETPFAPNAFSPSIISFSALKNITKDEKRAGELQSKQWLGAIWQSLGNMILIAVNKSEEESQFLMSNVLQILAHLHHRGFVPASVYASTTSTDPLSLRQPPIFNMLHSRMMESLTDTVYSSYFSEVDPSAQEENNKSALSTSERNTPQMVYKTDFSGLAPELWLEFTLWCCVHGGWISEGASIIGEMRKYVGTSKWSLINWRDIMEDPDTKWDALLANRAQANQILFHDNTTSLVTAQSRSSTGIERTISAEIVIALVDGLISSVIRAPASYVNRSIDQIKVLKSMLEREKLSLGVSTWDAAICRLFDSPELQNDQNPQMMESVLELAETYGREVGSTNAASNTNYIFDGSAAVLGFYHRTIRSYIRFRDLPGALRILSRLQKLTDSNKKNSIEEFWKKLKSVSNSAKISYYSMNQEVRTIRAETMFPGIQFPGFFPNVPPNILASLLDLITENGEFEIGQWLIYSKDIDGPMITKALYGDQAMAPALIRFGAATLDKQLLSAVTQAQGADISGKTLIAICDQKIQQANWDGAVEVLRLIQNHALHDWSANDFAILTRSLLSHLPFQPDKTPLDITTFQAASFLQKLLRGDLGQIWGVHFSQVDSITGILASLNPFMADLCSNILVRNRYYTLDLPTESFNLLLDGIAKSYGSAVGMNVYKTWCEDQQHSHRIQLFSSEQSIPTASERFFGYGKDSLQQDHFVNFQGNIERDISTIRVIIQQALQEERSTEEQGANTSSIGDKQHDQVLQWAAKNLKEEFDCSHTDIDYELQGHNFSINLDLSGKPEYNQRTLGIWITISGFNKQWAKEREVKLRDFALNKKERQVVFDPVPAAERFFLHSLAHDFGLISESFGDELERSVKVSKTPKSPQVPLRTVEESLKKSQKRQNNNVYI